MTDSYLLLCGVLSYVHLSSYLAIIGDEFTCCMACRVQVTLVVHGPGRYAVKHCCLRHEYEWAAYVIRSLATRDLASSDNILVPLNACSVLIATSLLT